MSLPLTPVSKLEAVNYMLQLVGEPPTNSLTAPVREDVVLAERALDQASRLVQAEGWHWNSEDEVTVQNAGAPDYYLQLGTNVLSARINYLDFHGDARYYTVRDQRIYDSKNQTDSFADITSIRVDQILYLDFEILPDVARTYITALAVVHFQHGTVQSTEAYQLLERGREQARANLENDELATRRYSLMESPDQYQLHYRR